MYTYRTAPLIALMLATVLQAPTAVAGQTDFYNLDKDRPLRVEDAYATKLWAFELKASPLTLSQDRAGITRFAPSIELKHGLLPGLEVSIGSGIETLRGGGTSGTELGEVEISALANLWIEGETLPAAAIRVTGHLATRSDHATTAEVKAILTRGLGGSVRAHLNGAVIAGGHRPESWWAGGALDYALPFHHTLLLAETWVSESRLGDADDTSNRVHSALGLRYQLSPTLVLDAGAGRSWSGDVREDWALTLGITHEFGVRALMPGGGR